MNSTSLSKKILAAVGIVLAGIILFVEPNELWLRFSTSIILIILSAYLLISESNNSSLQKKIFAMDEVIDEYSFLETTDPLTSLFNKRKIYELLEYEMEKNKRYKSGLSIIFCEIDDFSNIDKSTTDELLRSLAMQLTACLRKSDIVSRWSENQFLILIPNMAVNETKIAAEKIRGSIESYSFENIGKITTSLGITQHVENDNKVSIVERANKALNTAKEKGGNCVDVSA